MIKIKFNDSDKFFDVTFIKNSDHLITLKGITNTDTSGFTTWRMDGKTQLGNFSDFTTVYRQNDDFVQYSNDGSYIQIGTYITVDSANRITGIKYEHEYPSQLGDWISVDEGQSHQLDKPLMTEDGIYQYKYVDDTIQERTAEEIEADRASRPQPEPTEEEITLELLADHEYRLCMLELG